MSTFRGHYMKFSVGGKINGADWTNTWSWAVNMDATAWTEAQLTFTEDDLQAMMEPIWNDNGLIWGLWHRYANMLPNVIGNSIDYFKCVARSQTMLEPVQYIIGDSHAGARDVSTANTDVSWTAMYSYASCKRFGQKGAKLYLPLNDEQLKNVNQWTPAALALVVSNAEGVLNSINSQDHALYVHVDGIGESVDGHDNIIVKYAKTVIAPPSPPYKGIYKYDFPYSGPISAFVCNDFEPQPEVSHQDGRK